MICWKQRLRVWSLIWNETKLTLEEFMTSYTHLSQKLFKWSTFSTKFHTMEWAPGSLVLSWLEGHSKTYWPSNQSISHLQYWHLCQTSHAISGEVSWVHWRYIKWHHHLTIWKLEAWFYILIPTKCPIGCIVNTHPGNQASHDEDSIVIPWWELNT